MVYNTHPLLKLYPMRYAVNISQFVKENRGALKWTQVNLADRAGVGLRFVRDLEQGKTTLRMDKVNQVLDLFSVELGPVPIDRSAYA